MLNLSQNSTRGGGGGGGNGLNSNDASGSEGNYNDGPDDDYTDDDDDDRDQGIEGEKCDFEILLVTFYTKFIICIKDRNCESLCKKPPSRYFPDSKYGQCMNAPRFKYNSCFYSRHVMSHLWRAVNDRKIRSQLPPNQIILWHTYWKSHLLAIILNVSIL